MVNRSMPFTIHHSPSTIPAPTSSHEPRTSNLETSSLELRKRPPTQRSRLPFQDLVDGLDRDAVIGRTCLRINLLGALQSFRRRRELRVQRLEELATSLGRQELLEGRIGGLVPVVHCQLEPRGEDLVIAAPAESKLAVELSHLLGTDLLRQGVNEMQPFLRRPAARLQRHRRCR